MENKILSTLGRIAGLGGIALGVVLFLFRGVLEKNFLPQAGLGSEQAFAVILALMILTFGIAGIGVIAWLISRTVGPRAPVPGPALGILAVLVAIVLGSTIYVAAQAKPDIVPPERAKTTTSPLLDARAICGTPHEEVSQEIKGNLEGKAQTLARIGAAEIQGAISTAKKEIEVGTTRSDAERELHYLNYISCVLIIQDSILSTDEKLAL
jgi:hypothetical protein